MPGWVPKIGVFSPFGQNSTVESVQIFHGIGVLSPFGQNSSVECPNFPRKIWAGLMDKMEDKFTVNKNTPKNIPHGDKDLRTDD